MRNVFEIHSKSHSTNQMHLKSTATVIADPKECVKQLIINFEFKYDVVATQIWCKLVRVKFRLLTLEDEKCV